MMRVLEVHPGTDEVAAAAVKLVTDRIQQAASPESPFVLGLATGSTKNPVFSRLVDQYQEGGLSFAGVEIFHLDEYWPLQADDPAGFAASLDSLLVGQIDLNPGAFHSFPARVEEADTASICAAYRASIASRGGVDLQLLGVGTNGHLAFNEPGSGLDSRARKVKLDPETRARMPEGVDYQQALTLGIADILDSKEILFVATGAEKAESVRRALEESPSSGCPASFLQDHPATTWLLDADAASLLRTGDGRD